MATWNATIIQRNSAGGIIKITDTIEAVTSWDAKQILASKYNVEYKDVYVGSQVFAGESSTSSSASGEAGYPITLLIIGRPLALCNGGGCNRI